MEELPAVLEASLAPDEKSQQAASQWLAAAKEQDLSGLMVGLAGALSSAECSQGVRQQAGVQLKNCLTGQHDKITQLNIEQWTSLPEDVREHIKDCMMKTLGTEEGSSSAARVISTIAIIEMPIGGWQDVIEQLVGLVSTVGAENEKARESILDAVGFVTEGVSDINPSLLEKDSSTILTTVVHYLSAEETSMRVRLSAATALNNSLEFCSANFAVDEERHMIMEVVCEATQHGDSELQVAALQCLVRIVMLYYKYMEHYMAPALYGITMTAMGSEDQQVILQAVEFWTAVAEEEQELHEEMARCEETGVPPTDVSMDYVMGALADLMPRLFELLTHQDEWADPSDWTSAKAATTSIGEIAMLVHDDILTYALPFLEENIGNGNWQVREAALMAFTQCLEGPSKEYLQSILNQALVPICEMIKDESVAVRDTVAYSVSKVVDLFPEISLSEHYLPMMLEVFDQGIKQEPRVATNACWGLSCLAESSYSVASDAHESRRLNGPIKTFAVSGSFEHIVESLLQVTERQDGGEHNLRTAAFEALMSYLQNFARDCYPTVTKATEAILNRMGLALQHPDSVPQETMNQLCACVATLLRSLDRSDVLEMQLTVVQMLMAMFSSAGGTVHEDAFMALSALLDTLGPEGAEAASMFVEYVVAGLQNVEDYMVCHAANGVVSAMSRVLGPSMSNFAEAILTEMLSGLSNPMLERVAKIEIVGALGDVCLALGDLFFPYFEVVMQALAGESERSAPPIANENDFASIDANNDMREALLVAFEGLIQGLKGDDPKAINPQGVSLLAPHVSHMIQFLAAIIQDSELTDACIASGCGVVGDLCQIFGQQLNDELPQPFLDQLGAMGLESSEYQTKKQAQYMLMGVKMMRA